MISDKHLIMKKIKGYDINEILKYLKNIALYIVWLYEL